ncbi:TPA: phage tail tape measure protein [Clostridioides difficile]|nr:phage tail tape measure protein [Clostridioides difficile]
MANSEEIAKLSVSLALEASTFTKQMSSINKEIKNLDKDFKSAGKGVDGFEKTFVGLDAKIQKTTKQIDLYNKKLESQKKEYDKLSQTVEKQKSKLDEIEQSLGKGSKEWQKQAQLVQKNSEKLSGLGSSINQTESNLNQLSSELNSSVREFEQLGNKTKTIEEKLASVGRQADLSESEFNRLGTELQTSGSYFQKLGNDINTLASKLQSGEQKLNIYQQEIQKLGSTLEKSKTEHQRLAQEINQTENKLNQAKSAYGANSTEAQQLQQKLLQLKDRYNQVENEIEQNTNELTQYRTELNNTQSEINRLSNELRTMPFDRIGSDLQKAGNSIKSVGQTLTMGVTMPLIGVGAAATKAGVDFGTSMSKLQATAGIADKTSESYKKLETKAKEMGSSTSFSATEAADGLTFLALAGWDVETSISRIEPVLRAAEAGGMDLATCADLVTDSMSSAGVASEDFGKYLDITAQAQRKSNTSMQQMLEAYVVAGGMFDALNIPLSESGALLGILANRGTKGSEAGNALISVFSNLITETGQAGNALEKMGISLYNSEHKQKSMTEVLKELAIKLGVTADGTSNLTEQQKQQYAAMLGGKTQFDTLMKLLSGVSNEYDTLQASLENSDGALAEMAATMKDNLGGAIDGMVSAIEGALIDAFESLEPVLADVIKWITDAANWFNDLDSETQKNIIGIAAMAAALGPLLIGVGQLIIVGGNLVTLWGGISAAMAGSSVASSALTGVLAVLTGPVGIGALALAIAGIITKFGENEQALSTLQDKFGAFGEFLSTICEFIAGTVQLTFGNLLILLEGVGKSILAILTGNVWDIEGIWDETWAKMETNTSKAWSNINAESSSALSKLKSMSESELTGVKDAFTLMLEQLPNLTRDNVGEVANIFATELEGLDNKSIEILRGTSDTMAVLMAGIYENMSKDEATKQFTTNLNNMVASGKYSTAELQQDVEKAMNLINKNIGDGSTQLKKTATDMFNGFKEAAQRGIEPAVTGVVRQLETLDQESLSQLMSMGDTWSQAFNGISLDGSMSSEQMKNAILNNLKSMGIDANELISKLRNESSSHWKALEEDANNTGEVVAKSFDQIPKEIVTTLKNNGAESNAEIVKLNSMYDSLPEEIQTYIRANNMDALTGAENVNDVLAKIPSETIVNVLNNVQGTESVEMVQALLSALPEEERVKLETNVVGTEALDGVGQKIQELPKENNINTTVNTGDSNIKLDEINLKTNEINNKESIVRIDADVTQADQNISMLKNNTESNLNSMVMNSDTITKILENKVDINTKNAANKSNINTKKIETDVDRNTKTAKDKANKNTKDLENSTNKNTKSAADKAKSNMNLGADGVGTAANKMAQSAKSGTEKVAKNTDADFKKATKSVQQEATNMYNGAKTSFEKLAQIAKQAGSDAYNGMKTSFEKLSSIVGTAMSNAAKAANDAKSKFKSAGSAAGQAWIDGFNSKKSAMSNAVSSVPRPASFSILKKSRESKTKLTNDVSNNKGLERSPLSPRSSFSDSISETLGGAAKSIDVSSAFRKAGENSAKAYIEGLSSIEKGSNETINKFINSSQENLSKEQQLFSENAKELAKIQKEKNEKLQSLEDEHNKKIKELIQKRDKDIKEANEKYAKDKKKRNDAIKKINETFREGEVKANEDYQEKIQSTNKNYAEKELSLKEKQTEELKKLHETQAQAEKDFYKNMQDLKETYNKKLKDLNEKYISDEKKLNEEYEKIYDSKVKSLMGFVDLFSEVTSKNISSDKLMKNLEGQVEVFEKWDKDMNQLAGKIGKDLYEELLSKGAGSYKEIEALNGMSDEELKKYEELYNKKKELAKKRAEQDTKDEKARIERQIEELKETYSKQYDELGKQMAADVEKQLETVKGKFGVLPSQLFEFGKNAVQQFISGINSEKDNLLEGSDIFINSILGRSSSSDKTESIKENIDNIFNNIETSFKDMEDITKQTTSNMLKDIKQNFSNMKEESKRNTNEMSLAVKTESDSMSTNVKNVVISMADSVTNSTKSMADKAIADWERIRMAYSKSISGTITITTVHKSVNESSEMEGRSFVMPKPPDMSNYKLRGGYYSSSSNESRKIISKSKYNNEAIYKLDDKLSEIVEILSENKVVQENNITINASQPLSPSQVARKTRRELERMGRLI